MTEFETLLDQAGLTTTKDAADYLRYSEGTVARWKRGRGSAPRDSIIKLLHKRISEMESTESSDFTFVDLFAGIGGMRKAFEAHGGRCVWTSEWDKYARQTYQANFRDNREIAGDITKIDADEIPPHNVLVAGFPCQPFSIAGVSKKNALGRLHGFDDETQGTLFFDVLRILKAHRPEAFLLENVKNLKSHDGGRTFAIMRRKLEEDLGYQLHIQVIDAQHFVPQHRERVAMVGFRKAVPFSWDDLRLPGKGKRVMSSVLHPENGTEEPEGHYTLGTDAKVSDKYVLSDKLWTYLKDYAAKHQAKGNGFGYGLVTGKDVSRTLSARYYKDGSEILVSRGRRKNPRRLTPRECARLMGYPEDFRIPVSDTQAYKQFGNTVAVPVFTEVARIMRPHVETLIQKPTRKQRRRVA